MSAQRRLIGAPVKRKEDARFIAGRGKFTDDLCLPGQAYAWFVRSPHAHARVLSIDVEPARSTPGVIGVFTGQDLDDDSVKPLPCGWLITDINGEPMQEPQHPALARERVRHVGEPLAMVVAGSADAARDAAERISIEYEEMPAVVAARSALDADAPILHEDGGLTSNKCFTWALGDRIAVDTAFAGAAHVVSIDIENNRLIPNALEPRAINARYDEAEEAYTLYIAHQAPHLERLLMSAFVMGIPEHKLRVYSPDVGGGFGSKGFLYPEDVAVTWAAKRCGRPVKWTAERSESFLVDAHGRDHVTRAELALNAEGDFLAMRVKTVANLGAYLSTLGSAIPSVLYGTLLAGQYRTPSIYCEVDAVFTNTAPVDAYRGAGRPEAAYVVERLVSRAAWQLGMSQDAIRQRNLITEFPYQTPVALCYDIGDYVACLRKANELAGVSGFEQRKAESNASGKLRGIGYSSYIEACGIAPSAIAGALGARAGFYEAGAVRVHPTGAVTVLTGSHSHGQSHETTFAQVVADRLGIDVTAVDVVHGDTDRVPFGMGTYGSRSIAVGGAALARALDKVVAKATKIAAHLLETAEADIEFTDGHFTIKGTDKGVSFAEVALTAYVPHNYPLESLEPGLDETAFYDPTNFTYPAGTHICEVEIDPDTGVVRVDRFTAVDDFGTIINPMIVEGQVHGGVAQGIGQALLEQTVYDSESGQLLTGSYMDYAVPRADDLPDLTLSTLCTPCSHNPLGTKGCGEAGAIGAPAALMNAVLDALRERGVEELDMPATPERVWRALQDAAVR